MIAKEELINLRQRLEECYSLYNSDQSKAIEQAKMIINNKIYDDIYIEALNGGASGLFDNSNFIDDILNVFSIITRKLGEINDDSDK